MGNDPTIFNGFRGFGDPERLLGSIGKSNDADKVSGAGDGGFPQLSLAALTMLVAIKSTHDMDKQIGNQIKQVKEMQKLIREAQKYMKEAGEKAKVAQKGREERNWTVKNACDDVSNFFHTGHVGPKDPDHIKPSNGLKSFCARNNVEGWNGDVSLNDASWEGLQQGLKTFSKSQSNRIEEQMAALQALMSKRGKVFDVAANVLQNSYKTDEAVNRV